MQTSFNINEWEENQKDEALRTNLAPDASPTFKRRLFPLSARLIKVSPAFNLQVGQEFKYARTKMTPSTLPIEVLAWTQNGQAKVLRMFPHEVELLPPQD